MKPIFSVQWAFGAALMLLMLQSRASVPWPEPVPRQWNEEILAAIRIDKPNPPVHARNLFHVATAMYDAWAAYDDKALGYIHHERLLSGDPGSARVEAISYAAYRLLRNRYAGSVNAATSLKSFDERMLALGYDTNFVSTIGNSPAALGNRIAADIIAWGLADGSNQAAGYDDPFYVNSQPPMIVLQGGVPGGYGVPAADPNRWEPLALDASARFQNGLVAEQIQKYVGVTWLRTLPFALERSSSAVPWIDPGPPARLGTWSDAEYKAGALAVLRASSELGSTNIIDCSPAAMGNNELGQDNNKGYQVNPSTGKPYEKNLVTLGDFTRVMAEFWADGPNSETPPGHWHVLANQVTDAPSQTRQIGGKGPVLDDMEWQVKLYFVLSAATHDAACAAWSLKRYYEGVRPITAIRMMAALGQSSDPKLPSYNPNGLPLEPGISELVTEQTAAEGGRHAGVASPGEVVVFSWPGEPENRATQTSKIRWIRGMDWLPYQRKNFVTPAFPGYVSGHSTFSRAAAEVLTAMTGSPFFPGGLGKFHAAANSYLVFERGPAKDTELQWATYYDAADLAGQSRRWGGIHVPQDDYMGRFIGSSCGHSAWDLAQNYWNGEIASEPFSFYQSSRPGAPVSVTLGTRRGLYYQLESSPDLVHWTPAAAPLRATDTTLTLQDPNPATQRRFYRVSRKAEAL